jgi:nucleoside-diphosphate-sugar epimerase
MGYLNTIWQQDAAAMSLESLAHASTPPNVLNITGPDTLSVRQVAEEFAARMGKTASFEGTESSDALLSNGAKAFALLGKPEVGIGQLLTWIADWVVRGETTLAKPTHFEERAGRF